MIYLLGENNVTNMIVTMILFVCHEIFAKAP